MTQDKGTIVLNYIVSLEICICMYEQLQSWRNELHFFTADNFCYNMVHMVCMLTAFSLLENIHAFFYIVALLCMVPP